MVVGLGLGSLVGLGLGLPVRLLRRLQLRRLRFRLWITAIAVGLEWLNYRAGSLARAITMALSTESWDLRLGDQYGPTSATMDMQANLFFRLTSGRTGVSAVGYSCLLTPYPGKGLCRLRRCSGRLKLARC